jgi:hypothetical protein
MEDSHWRARHGLGARSRGPELEEHERETIFDEALVTAHERLAGDPRNRAAKVDFVTIYGAWFLQHAIGADPGLAQVARPFALDALIGRLALVGVRLGSA